jgi:hypothetical protein
MNYGENFRRLFSGCQNASKSRDRIPSATRVLRLLLNFKPFYLAHAIENRDYAAKEIYTSSRMTPLSLSSDSRHSIPPFLLQPLWNIRVLIAS